jgi:opacity protein-like surface antigen
MMILRGIGAIAVACLLGGSSLAADMPLAPPVPASEPTARDPSSGNWYLRGDIGYVIPKASVVAPAAIPFFNTDTQIWDSSDTVTSHVRNGHGWSLGGGVGYDFGAIRTDVTADYMFAARSTADRIGFNYQNDEYRCELDAHCTGIEDLKTVRATLLANLYFEPWQWEDFTPYVGIGFGAVRRSHQLASGQNCNGNEIDCTPDHAARGPYDFTGPTLWQDQGKWKSWSLAGALMAGVSYDLGNNLALDLNYRFLYTKDSKVSGDYTYLNGSTVGTVKLENQYDNEFRAGLRYTFVSQ